MSVQRTEQIVLLKPSALTPWAASRVLVLELLAFNTQKFTGSRDPGHAHVSETFVRGHVGTISVTRLSSLQCHDLLTL